MSSAPVGSAPDPAAVDEARLRRLLGDPALSWVVERARRRLATGSALTGRVTLATPDDAQRHALARLLGTRPRAGGTIGVDLGALDRLLIDSGIAPGGLPAAVIALTGPVADERAAAAARTAAWDAVHAAFLSTLPPALHEWAHAGRRTGLLARLARTPEAGARLADDAARVIARLPAGHRSRGRLAAEVLGSAHALDDGRPVTTLVFGAARALSGHPDGQGAAWRRSVWAAVEVSTDDLSSTVLVLGLQAATRHRLGRLLAAGAGEPLWLSLRQVQIPDLATALGEPRGPVFICENPIVPAVAADRGLPEGVTLVCVNGQPGTAAHVLLEALAARHDLAYHGDFDWAGVRIANAVIERHRARPWRMAAADYRAGVRAGVDRPRHPLGPVPAAPLWDPELAAEMAAAGQAVEEEHVLDDLLVDLTTGNLPRSS